ncbi:hypothetical protein SUGI_0742600 [Cryptomeria japonica]|uniref:uncharacterized protein LOC131065746 n=1 Tax=Cryptomeria japonica TaxID=3369 RepID=UPI002414A859|nr:uncharacterized protein LOC131065746 [Cryptomeria japonica]GLJ36813.1 hypothetical protein SUGI_0742600 [Cryptomeria japonica]
MAILPLPSLRLPLYSNSNSSKLCFIPPHYHSHVLIKPITAKFEKQRAEESVKSISAIYKKQKQSQTMAMIMNEEGFPRKKQKKVAVYWDLDNKPPKVAPFDAAVAVREIAGKFGEIVDMAAFANRHAFTHVPQWIVEQRRERKQMDFMESKSLIKPEQPYICGVCGRKCKTNVDLKKHFKQLHERERHKKLSRMNSLKGKRKAKFREQFREKDEKYQNAARTLVIPKVGYGLASELRRAGVYVKTVEDKPQAADAALKAQIQHSMSRGIDCMFLISDDSDFSDMLDKARKNNTRTVVLGDSRALIRHADLWLSWDQVTSGNAGDAIHTVLQKWSTEDAVLDEILDFQDTGMDYGYQYDSDQSESDTELDQMAEMIVKAEGRLPQIGSFLAFSEEEPLLQADAETGSLEKISYDAGDWDR